MYFRKEIGRDMEPSAQLNPSLYTAVVAVLAFTALAVIVFGIFPQNLLALIQASAM